LKSQVVPSGGDEDRFHFAYEDGTKFLPFGTTCYAWVNQPEEVQEQTLKTLKDSPFNKVRMCIFPKFYTYNTANPERYAFLGNEEEGFDFTRFNPEFWDNLERRIGQLDALGIEADVILFHPISSLNAKISTTFHNPYMNRSLLIAVSNNFITDLFPGIGSINFRIIKFMKKKYF